MKKHFKKILEKKPDINNIKIKAFKEFLKKLAKHKIGECMDIVPDSDFFDKIRKNVFILILISFLSISCSPSLKTTSQIDNMLNDIYKQKVLLCVYKTKSGTVIFENPIGDKQYLCTSYTESKRWNTGDTLIIRYKGKLLSDEDEKTILSLKPHRKKK